MAEQQRWLRRPALAVACVLLVGVVGLVGVRISQAPGVGGENSPAAEDGPVTRLVGVASDGTLRLEVSLYNDEMGTRRLVSVIRNLSSGPVELRYDCDNLVRLNGLAVVRDCVPLPPVTLRPGQSGKEELLLPAAVVQNPTVATLAYVPAGQQAVTLKVDLQPGGIERLSPTEVAERMKAAGLQVTGPAEGTSRLFGAQAVHSLTAQGRTVMVYTFDDQTAAERALRTASDPQANTVEWAEAPRFLVKTNLLIAVLSNDPWVTKQVVLSLDDGPPPIALRPMIRKERALELAQGVDKALPWEAHLVEQNFDVTIRGARLTAPVWIVEARDAAGQATVLYVDAKSGRIASQLQVATGGSGARTPEEAVRQYLGYTSAGKYEAAWTLLDPISQKPNPAMALGLSLARFYGQEGTTGPGLRTILEVMPPKEGIGTKDPSCMCYLRKATVRVELTDGTPKTFEVVAAANGTWGVMWRWQNP